MLSSEAEAWSQVCGDAVFISRFNHPITFEARCALATAVARLENTALYESVHTGNFSVAATEQLLPAAADPFSRQQKCC
jgi:hypothetical protein